ncbi:BppU family phage baseplate upper protein [Lactobacillus gigeriorum]|uniref:Minor capsid protein n=1 Tax=Lactobacillus gigeriorum DSM 23908 = CRBIP 24.85 TaxID=1423751 RepID=A0ABR5PWZ5_9LACO|nr:BppU family phage baseplate upper protein [Lactobacillus gigeriorum]KRN12015.1 minor capsid protein [Lactobacillus gigeriorum DSM 23908 = CRBIP 24.85]
MKLQELILTTDKSTQVVDDRTRIIRQSEKGIVLPVTIVDENNAPYDLTDISIAFNEIKKGDKIVIDTGDPSNDYNGKIIKTDPKNGRFEYTLQRQVYAADGTAYFSLQKGSEIVDTTKDFYFKVIPAPVIYLPNDNYASSMEAELNRLKAEASRVASMISGYSDDVKGQVDKIGQMASDEFAKSVQNMKDQLASFSQGLTDYSNEFAKLKDGWNGQVADDRANLQKDYDAWKQQQLDSFNSQIQPIRDALSQSQSKADEITKETADATAKVEKLMKDLEGYDFTQFVKPSDLDNYYNKSRVDDLVANAGKVKTVNGNQPDGNGNVQVPIPSTDGLAKTSDLNKYLPLAGGKLTDQAIIKWDETANLGHEDSTSFPYKVGGIEFYGENDWVKLFAEETSRDNLNFVIQLGDDDTPVIYIRNSTGQNVASITQTGLYTGKIDYSNVLNAPSDQTAKVTDLINRVTKLEQNPGGTSFKQASSEDDAYNKSKADTSSIYYW